MKSAASNKETVARLMNQRKTVEGVCVCVCVCVLKGDQLTFDYLAEHSLTWWLTLCFTVTTALITHRLIGGVTRTHTAWHTHTLTNLPRPQLKWSNRRLRFIACCSFCTHSVTFTVVRGHQVTAVACSWQRGTIINAPVVWSYLRIKHRQMIFKAECLRRAESSGAFGLLRWTLRIVSQLILQSASAHGRSFFLSLFSLSCFNISFEPFHTIRCSVHRMYSPQ